MANDRAKPENPVKPGDLAGCTDAQVVEAKGKSVAAVQNLTGLTDKLKPLALAVTNAIQAK